MNIKQLIIIDRCLRDKSRLWTINDLVEACSGEKKVSVRSVRTNINYLRKHYGAPIVVSQHKYYQYSESGFSPKNNRISDKEKLGLVYAVDMIRDYCRLIQTPKAERLFNEFYEEMVNAFHLPRFIEVSECDMQKTVVRLWVDAEIADSIKKHPIHKSQQLEMEEIDGSIIILLRLPVTMTFKLYLFSNYPRIKVEYPASLIAELKKLSSF